MKPSLQELLRLLPKKTPALAPEVSGLLGLVKKLDDSLEGCAPAADVWQLYRKVLGFYSQHGKFVGVAPPVPAAGQLGSSLFSTSGSGAREAGGDSGSGSRPSSRAASPVPAAAGLGLDSWDANASNGGGSMRGVSPGADSAVDEDGSAGLPAAVYASDAYQQEVSAAGEGRSVSAPGFASDDEAAAAAAATVVGRPDSAAAGTSSSTSTSGAAFASSTARPASPGNRPIGAAAVVGRSGSLARSGSPLQWSSTSARGASGNLSSSSSRSVSRTGTPNP